jgi:hypothetical protein
LTIDIKDLFGATIEHVFATTPEVVVIMSLCITLVVEASTI